MKVPYYGIFEPDSGDFELYRLGGSGVYDRVLMEESGRYWIEAMNLSIAAWKGTRDRRQGYWLRFWDASERLLPWFPEMLETTQQELRQTQRQLSEEKLRADRLLAKLRSLGIELD